MRRRQKGNAVQMRQATVLYVLLLLLQLPAVRTDVLATLFQQQHHDTQFKESSKRTLADDDDDVCRRRSVLSAAAGVTDATHVFFFFKSGRDDVLDAVRHVYRDDVARGVVAFFVDALQRGGAAATTGAAAAAPAIVHCAPLKVDRSCLVKPPVAPTRVATPFVVAERDAFTLEAAVGFVNAQATLFRQPPDGQLTAFGTFMAGLGGAHLHGPHSPTFRPQCDRIPFASLLDTGSGVRAFVHNYLLHQRPVVITGFPTSLDSRNGTLLELLLSRHGDEAVGVKLSPSADFEGIDLLTHWGMATTQAVPPDVLQRMESPHLVVVRPRHAEMKVGHVVDLIRRAGGDAAAAARAYVEYLPLTHMRLPGLLARLLPLHRLPAWLGFPTGDVATAPAPTEGQQLPPLLRQGKAHAWLGDGRTVGKLHFDAFDNLLVQLVGAKTFHLLPADPVTNALLREGHMREAVLGADVVYRRRADGRVLTEDEAALLPHAEVDVSVTNFRKHTLSESTSMVHSPIPVTFGGNSTLAHMECRVNANEALFVPSYWWHEVASSPGHEDVPGGGGSSSIPYNFAVNVWWAPLFEKEFPCPSCSKRPNYKTYMDTFQAIHKRLQ